MDWANLDRLSDRRSKFVVMDRADYDYARDVVARHALDRKVAAVLFSPVHGVLDPDAERVGPGGPASRPGAVTGAQYIWTYRHAACRRYRSVNGGVRSAK